MFLLLQNKWKKMDLAKTMEIAEETYLPKKKAWKNWEVLTIITTEH